MARGRAARRTPRKAAAASTPVKKAAAKKTEAITVVEPATKPKSTDRKQRTSMPVDEAEAIHDENASVEEGTISVTWGFSMRVFCINPRCEMHKQMQVTKVDRVGGVLRLHAYHCAKCLYQMAVYNKELAEKFGME